MNLLAAKLYDPAVAVSKATSALLAMTAFDTANLRLAITVPAHGMVRFRIRCIVTGATTCPTVLLGVLNGATVIGRVTPSYENATANLATQSFLLDAEFTVTGLAAGAMNVDAAYDVEVLVAATNIKYGGPNDTTTANAWGAFVFEAWDPQPQTTTGQLSVDASGRVDVIKVAGTTQTAGDLKASMNTLQADTDDIQTRLPAALVAGRIDASVGAMAANVLTAAAINADAITAAKIADGAIDAATFAAGAINAAAIGADAITDAKVAADVTIASVTGAVGSVTGNVGGNVVGSVASVTAAVTLPAIPANWITAAGIAADAIGASELAADAATEIGAAVWATATRVLTANTNLNDLNAAGVRGAVGLASANLDTQLGAIAGYIDTEIGSIISTLNTIAGYIDTEVAAIKLKTDNLPASPAATGAAMTLTAGAVDAILDEVVEGTTTMRELLRLYAAVLLGKASGLASVTAVFRDLADTKDRVTATVDADGNRTAVTRDAT